MEEGDELGDIEVVGGGDAFQSLVLDKPRGGEVVGNVEGEIPTPAMGAEKVQVGKVSDQIAIGFGFQHLVQDPVFPLLVDPGWGDPDGTGAGGGAEGLSGEADDLRVSFGVFPFAIQRVDTLFEGGFELGQGSDEDNELGICWRDGGGRGR